MITRVNQVIVVTPLGASPQTIALGFTTSKGNLLVIAIPQFIGAEDILSVVSNTGAIFSYPSSSKSTNNASGIDSESQIFYLLNTTGGDTHITLTFASANEFTVFAAEYHSSLGLISFVNAVGLVNASPGGSTLLGPSIIGTGTNNFFVATETDDSASETAPLANGGSTFTDIIAYPTNGGSAFSELLNVAGTKQPKWQLDSPCVSPVASLICFSETSLPYSVPDCRDYATFPNSFRNVQGTLTYDAQTSSNHSVPSTDSRKAGAPVDCRVSPNIPENSRTPGTYGPGE